MLLSQSLGGEIKGYIMSLLGKDSVIVNYEGVCLTSPDKDEIGQKLKLPEEAFSISKPMVIDTKGSPQLYIPLEYQNDKVAILILQDNQTDLGEYIPLIKSFAELLIQQYYETNKPVLDSTDQFITKLLNNSSPQDFPFYESEAKVLGYDLSSKRIGIVVHLGGFWDKCLLSIDQPSFERDQVIKNAKKNIETAINSFFSRNNDIIIAYLGNDKFVVFKRVSGEDEESVRNFLKKSYKAIFEPLKNYRIENVAVGYGNAYTGIEGLISAYKEANLSLELGQKLWGDNKSYFFEDLGILSVLGEGNREKNLQFANQMLSKMRSEDLHETLECFFDQNLNLTETAEKLGVHRNTIIYRLNQISKILGADPRIFDQALTIKIALLIRKLFINA